MARQREGEYWRALRGTTSGEGRWAHSERDEYWKGTVGVRREKQVRSFEIHSRAGEREREREREKERERGLLKSLHCYTNSKSSSHTYRKQHIGTQKACVQCSIDG